MCIQLQDLRGKESQLHKTINEGSCQPNWPFQTPHPFFPYSMARKSYQISSTNSLSFLGVKLRTLILAGEFSELKLKLPRLRNAGLVSKDLLLDHASKT